MEFWGFLYFFGKKNYNRKKEVVRVVDGLEEQNFVEVKGKSVD